MAPVIANETEASTTKHGSVRALTVRATTTVEQRSPRGETGTLGLKLVTSGSDERAGEVLR
jgi:hypothetical protein